MALLLLKRLQHRPIETNSDYTQTVLCGSGIIADPQRALCPKADSLLSKARNDVRKPSMECARDHKPEHLKTQ